METRDNICKGDFFFPRKLFVFLSDFMFFHIKYVVFPVDVLSLLF